MKIYFIANTFRGFGSGKGYWFHKVSELLSKKEKVIIFSLKAIGKNPNTVPFWRKNVVTKLRNILKDCSKKNAILHFPQYHLALLIPFFRLIFKCPIVIGPNTLPLQTPTGKVKPSIKERLVINTRFNKIIALSKAHKIVLEKYGIPSNKIKIIKPGIELSIFKPMKISRKKYGIDKKDVVFAFINRFAKVKQFELFEKAMKTIIRKHKYVKFLIIGKKLKIKNKKVINLGFINRSNLPKYYNLCDIYINTSKWETYSIANMEALACGKPCIMTNVGGNPEQIIPGKTGFLVRKDCTDLVKKMEIFVKNVPLVKKMSKEARKFALKELNWNSKIKDLLKLYQSLLEN